MTAGIRAVKALRVTDFLIGLLLIGLAALFAMVVRLQVRLRHLEESIGRGGMRGAKAAEQPRGAEALRGGEPATLANLFENLVGGRLLIWVGGVALVVAAVFLIRYSIEIGLITPAMRMVAAAIFGAALLALGEWAHRAHRLAEDERISQALVGAGLAVLYATVYGSYILYGFLGINTASLLMLVITIGALGLSFRHGIGTAALGLIGGFMTPWLVGDPDAGALPLLAYIALLDIAVFAIAWRRGWGWLAGVAVVASFAWTLAFLFGSREDALAAGWFAVALGILAGSLRPAGTSLTWIQPVAIAATEVTILVARNDVETWGWLAYAVIASAAVIITRVKEHPPAVPLYVLVLGVLLIPVRFLFHDESGIAAAAAGMTLLFGVGSLVLAVERRSGLWAALAAVGFAAPGLVLRWTYPGLLGWNAWGAMQALLALGPVSLVFIRRAQLRDGGADDTKALDFLALLPALTAAALLALAAHDLTSSDYLSIAWLALAIAFIAAGMTLKSFAFRIAGLTLLTVTVLKLFLIDAAALDGVLRILSFAAGGAALIVLGWFYGILLKGERRESDRPSEERGSPRGEVRAVNAADAILE